MKGSNNLLSILTIEVTVIVFILNHLVYLRFNLVNQFVFFSLFNLRFYLFNCFKACRNCINIFHGKLPKLLLQKCNRNYFLFHIEQIEDEDVPLLGNDTVLACSPFRLNEERAANFPYAGISIGERNAVSKNQEEALSLRFLPCTQFTDTLGEVLGCIDGLEAVSRLEN